MEEVLKIEMYELINEVAKSNTHEKKVACIDKLCDELEVLQSKMPSGKVKELEDVIMKTYFDVSAQFDQEVFSKNFDSILFTLVSIYDEM